MPTFLAPDHWLTAIRGALFIVALRGTPFALYCAIRSNGTLQTRFWMLTAYASILLTLDAHFLPDMAWWAGGLTYYVVATLVLRRFSRELSQVRGLDKLIVFTFSLAVFLVAPALVFPTAARTAFLFLGWELVLKAYSYVLEGGARNATLCDSLFFFIVDPTIVFTQRATPATATFGSRHLLRVGGGALCLSVLYLLEATVFDAVSQLMTATSMTWVALGTVMLGFTKLIAAYARHSGVASVQIGLMRALGWQIGERYNYPLAARSPREFWSRWNIYVGDWVKRYAYFPLAIQLARRAGTRKVGAHAISLAVTFLSVGAFHDLYRTLAESNPTLRATAFFAANALLIFLWVGFETLQIGTDFGRKFGLSRVAAPRGVFALAFLGLLGVWR
jgi:hypothetical protein